MPTNVYIKQSMKGPTSLLAGNYVELNSGIARDGLIILRGSALQVLVAVSILWVVPAMIAVVEAGAMPRPPKVEFKVTRLVIPPKPKPQQAKEVAKKQPSAKIPDSLHPQPVPAEPPQPLRPPKNPWFFAYDGQQHLPLVLAKWNGSLVFGRADEPDTYRLQANGPDFRTFRPPLQSPAAVNDGSSFDVILNDSEKYQIVRDLRAMCPECGGLSNVWAVFPESFYGELMNRLNRVSQTVSPTTRLVIAFDSRDPAGIVISPSGDSAQ